MRITNNSNEADENELVDILSVQVDKSLPQPERVKDFRNQLKDMNLYRCGDMKINAVYANNGKFIEDCLRSSVT